VMVGGCTTIDGSGSCPFVRVPVECHGFAFSTGTGVTLQNTDAFARSSGRRDQRARAESTFSWGDALSPMELLRAG
jgi:hypothetical protein